MQEQIRISSPRAPRSSHHRSSSTRTSPRQRDRVRSVGGNSSNQPNYDGSKQPALVPENLNDDRDTFNVDPTSGTLEAGGETYQPHIEPAGRRNFVGGFIGGMRKALQRNNNRMPPEQGIAYPEPAVVHEEETQYEPVPRTEPEMQPVGPIPGTPYIPPPLSDGRRTASSEVHYAADPAQYTSVAADEEYPEREPHRRQESSSSYSETVHAATTQEHYEGTTIVNHDMVLAAQLGSPEYVEPQPASDYAKMDSPPRSEASFGSYLTRLHRFFQTINDMPWIAPDRVTVDYIPGKARQQTQGPTPRPRPARRPIISWYNSNVPQGSIDLLSSGTPTSHLAEFPQAKAMVMATPSARYTDVVYANNIPVPTTPAGPPPMAHTPTARDTGTPTRPRRVPVPQLSPDLAAATVAADEDPFYSPRYPNGYVPYDQLSGEMTQTYTGSSGAPSILPPEQPIPQHQQHASGAL
ncbi:hypothetical protein MVEN_01497500 [Mycena venus]|uniref:Uncharacterized protein n=1 Tax=Mycena venus TaxID=2733690 RepID=A0A8H6XVN4_9AGAR|nr:hypothetical protein MVEN_01497500 [Mycena venus]